MKTKTPAVLASMFFGLMLQAQGPQANTITEKQVTELGTVGEIKVSLVRTVNVSDKSATQVLYIEHLPKKSRVSDTKTEITQVSVLNDLLKSLRELITLTDGNAKSSYKMTSSCGIEAGVMFVEAKPKKTGSSASHPAPTKNEKFYVQTTEKTYEGHTVFHDDKGSYIWKTSVVEQPASTGGATTNENPQWQLYFQVEKNVGYSRVVLSKSDLRTLVDLMESAKSKM